MSKILIIGKRGSGKTTLATTLAPNAIQFEDVKLTNDRNGRPVIVEITRRHECKDEKFTILMQNSRNMGITPLVVTVQTIRMIPYRHLEQFDIVYVLGRYRHSQEIDRIYESFITRQTKEEFERIYKNTDVRVRIEDGQAVEEISAY